MPLQVTRTVTFAIQPEVLARFPSLRVGVMLAADLPCAAATLPPQDGRHPRSRGRIAALCDALSERHRVHVSAHDLDAFAASSVSLRPAQPHDDWFVPLAAQPNDAPLDASLLVYAAGHLVLASSPSPRESRQTCVRPDTREAMFFSEAVDAHRLAAASAALFELRTMLGARGARVSAAMFADRDHPFVEISLDGPGPSAA